MSASRIIRNTTLGTAGLAVATPLVARAALRRPRGEVFPSEGVGVHFTEEGTGEPLVLLHGFAVNGDLNWRLPGLVKKLSPEFRVILPDLRGHGATGPAPAYGRAMADDVARLLDHLGIDRAHVAGYSLGGVVTLKTATLHPDRLITASTLGSGWEHPDNSMFLGAIDEIAAALESGRGVGPLSQHLGDDRHEPGLLHRTWVRFMSAFLNDGPALAGVVRGIPELTVNEDELADISIPMCGISGSLDPMREGTEALEGRVHNLELTIIEGADHLSATSHPELYGSFVSFLRRHSDPPA